MLLSTDSQQLKKEYNYKAKRNNCKVGNALFSDVLLHFQCYILHI